MNVVVLGKKEASERDMSLPTLSFRFSNETAVGDCETSFLLFWTPYLVSNDSFIHCFLLIHADQQSSNDPAWVMPVETTRSLLLFLGGEALLLLP
jgi:hypothetical protein